MQWISTVVEHTGDRKYRVMIWDRKDVDDAEQRMVYHIHMDNPLHQGDQDELRVSLMAWVYFLLNKKNIPQHIKDGRNLIWQTTLPDAHRFVSRDNLDESLTALHDYIFTRFQGLNIMPMAQSLDEKVRVIGGSWWEVTLPFIWHRETLESPLGPVEITQSALVKYARHSVHQENTSVIGLLRERLTSDLMQEYGLPEIILEQKHQRYGNHDVRIFFHTHYPKVKLLFIRKSDQLWRLVEVFEYDHRRKNHPQSRIKKSA